MQSMSAAGPGRHGVAQCTFEVLGQQGHSLHEAGRGELLAIAYYAKIPPLFTQL